MSTKLIQHTLALSAVGAAVALSTAYAERAGGRDDGSPRLATAIPAKHLPVISGDEGGIAGPAAPSCATYIANIPAANFYAPLASPNGPAVSSVFEDIPIPNAVLGPATSINVKRVTVDVARLANAPAMDVSLYWSTATTGTTLPDTELDQPPTFVATMSLPANGATAIIQPVTFGDGAATLFTATLNDTMFTGFRTFMLGIRLSANTDQQGWLMTLGPASNGDAFWQLDNNNQTESRLFFGGNPVARFSAIVEGTLIAQPACAADIVVNNNVDVLDLLAVINGWGPCP